MQVLDIVYFGSYTTPGMSCKAPSVRINRHFEQGCLVPCAIISTEYLLVEGGMDGSLLVHEPRCVQLLKSLMLSQGTLASYCAFVQLKLMVFWNSDALMCFCRRLLSSWDSRYSLFANSLDDLT